MASVRTTSFSASANLSAVAARVSAVHILRADAPGADAFLEVYDKATAPTLGTDTPVLAMQIPQETQAGKAHMFKVILPGGGLRCTNGIGIGVTTAFNGATGATTSAPQAVDVFFEVGG